MARLLDVYSSSWEMLEIPNGFAFSDLKLSFTMDKTCFTVNLNVVLKVLKANRFRCRRPSTALIESTIVDCYKRHIASGGEVNHDGARLLKSERLAAYNEAVPPARDMMH